MRGRYRYRKARREWLRMFAVAFGIGLFLALFCSVRFALLIASVLLIYVGVSIRSC